MEDTAYVSRATLARRLDISEGAVNDYVRRGLLPKPIRLGGSVRWRWETVDQALASLEGGGEDTTTPNDKEGIRRAIEAAGRKRS